MILGRRRRSSTQELPTLDQARPAGEFVASVLSHLREVVDVGWNLLEVDAEAHRLIREAGATSCYLDYHPVFGASPFGYVICTSLNDGVLHGRPYDRVLADGDLLSLDFAVEVDGWVADSCLSITVGTPREEDLQLIRDTEQVMWAGIDQVRAGSTVGDIGHAVMNQAHALGYMINDRFGGHGVGRTMHEAPFVPNHGTPGGGAELVARPADHGRTVPGAHHLRAARRRRRRVDPAVRRRLPRRPRGAHAAGHRRGTDHPHRPGGRPHPRSSQG